MSDFLTRERVPWRLSVDVVDAVTAPQPRPPGRYLVRVRVEHAHSAAYINPGVAAPTTCLAPYEARGASAMMTRAAVHAEQDAAVKGTAEAVGVMDADDGLAKIAANRWLIPRTGPVWAHTMPPVNGKPWVHVHVTGRAYPFPSQHVLSAAANLLGAAERAAADQALWYTVANVEGNADPDMFMLAVRDYDRRQAQR